MSWPEITGCLTRIPVLHNSEAQVNKTLIIMIIIIIIIIIIITTTTIMIIIIIIIIIVSIKNSQS